MMLRPIRGGCTLSVRVQAGAKRDAISGTEGDALKVSVTAATSDDRANAAVIALLAKRLGIPRTSIEVLSGGAVGTETLRVVRMMGITASEAEARLLNDLA